MADPVYRPLYNKYVADFAKNVFVAETTIQRMEALHKMITPYVTGADGEKTGYTLLRNASEFPLGLESLKAHVLKRHELIAAYLKLLP